MMNLFNKKKGNKGFTLVELLATIVILGILSSMAIAGVSVLIKKAKNSEEEANAKVIQMAAESYFQSNTKYLPKEIGSSTYISAGDLKKANFITIDLSDSNGDSSSSGSGTNSNASTPRGVGYVHRATPQPTARAIARHRRPLTIKEKIIARNPLAKLFLR